MITVDVQHRLGSIELEARFVSDGGVTALFGRSGTGKTSLVNIICGLIRPDRAHISLDGDVLVDTKQRIFVPKHRRASATSFRKDASSRISPCARTCFMVGGSRPLPSASAISTRWSSCSVSDICSAAVRAFSLAARSNEWR